MVATLSTEEFLGLVEKSRLLTAEAYAAAVERGGLADMLTAEDVADSLVGHHVLTRYQANRLLEGRRRGLFLDDYKLLEILGAGGMGYLYAAEELSSGFTVALKVLSDRHRNDKGMLTRFQLEAEAGLRLSHPNILRTRALKNQ